MTQGLIRYQKNGHTHFITFSCYQRRPYLASDTTKALFEDALERTRLRYRFAVYGYVLMPEHVHLLVSEPEKVLLARAIKALKLSVALRTKERPFWQARYYDFNVFSNEKRTEKLRYIHRNPVSRGLVHRPEDYRWSSFNHYAIGEPSSIEIESERTASLRERNKALSLKNGL
jgi:putative transposase